MALAALIGDAKIMLGVLVEILGGNSVAARRRFAREGDVTLEYLMRTAADLYAGAVAFEGLVSLRPPRLLEWPVAVIAPAPMMS
jgi:hypothetical protein